MEEQRKRARSSAARIELQKRWGLEPDLRKRVEGLESHFVGYRADEYEGLIVGVSETYPTNMVVIDYTPFYAEGGGQVGDIGVIEADAFRFRVDDTERDGPIIKHWGRADRRYMFDEIREKSVRAKIDAPRRRNIERNHTATHLVHEALRQVLGTHLHQQGSLVAPDRLRFDFNHFQKVSPDEIRKIEDIVNEKIADGIAVSALNDPKDWITIEEAKRRYPNVKMFFGDKYGDRVRIVEIDPKFSVELCGGTHVKNTRDIGLFKIISESSIASGIRRIEAVTGKGIDEYIEKQLVKRAGELDDELARLIEEKETLEKELNVRPETKTEPETSRPSLGQVESAKPTLESIRSMELSLRERENTVSQLIDETKSLKKALSRKKVREEVSNIDDLLLDAVSVDGFKVVSAKVDASTMDELKSIADSLRAKIGSGVGVLGAVVQDKVALVCVVTDDIIREKHIEAGKVVGEVAKLVGGGGGGRPHLATAGGKDVQKLDEALKRTAAIVHEMIPH
jgi:alanyl-tRNA synthetase